jgi:hypothetical protein
VREISGRAVSGKDLAIGKTQKERKHLGFGEKWREKERLFYPEI